MKNKLNRRLALDALAVALMMLLIIPLFTYASDPVYNRSEWGIWRTKACLTTREHLLIAESTEAVTLSQNRCDVIAGRWVDPYTNNAYTSPKAMDVDHIVPPKWALTHGAAKWTRNQKVLFANDLMNLNAVGLSINRSKGDRGAREWLPPNKEYHCTYIYDFNRIVRKHGLRYKNGESTWINNKLSACKRNKGS